MKSCIYHEYLLNMKRSLNLIIYLLNFMRFFVLLSQSQHDDVYIFKISCVVLIIIVDAIINIKTRFFIIIFQNEVDVA